MRRTAYSLIFCVWAAAALAAAPTNSTAALGSAACLQKASPAIVTLYAMDRRYKRCSGRGTGFLIRQDGVVVTARHVSEADEALLAVTADGKQHRVTGFYGEDRDYDVAVVKIEGSGFAHLSLAAAPLPQTNQWAAVVTPDTNGHLLCVTGAVQAVMNVPDIFGLILVTLPVPPGQSGSPLLNESGEAIGVAGGRYSGTNGFGAPVNVVQRILDHAGAAAPVPFAKRPRKGASPLVFKDETFRAAAAAVGREDWAGAEPLAKQAVKRFPESALTLMLLGVTHVKREDWQAADAVFARVVRLKPDSAFGWVMRGASSFKRGRFAQADAALRRSINLGLTDKGQLTNAWSLIAIADVARNNAKGAREALDSLQRLDPAKAAELRRDLQRGYPKLALSAN